VNNKVDILLGLQWGDEGKGKLVDVLTPRYDIIARFQGGPNAGHTLEFEGTKHVLHTIPSGIFHSHVTNLVGNGVVIDPVVFAKEIDALIAKQVPVRERLLISRKAHVIVPTHRLLDRASEASKGESKIGSTLKGIGPSYMDKTGRNGLRVGDLLSADFNVRYEALKQKHLHLLKGFEGHYAADAAELQTGEAMRKVGNEYGSTTGRARRCGWVDLPAMRYACMINGVTQLIMMKADVLSQFDTIRVCTHYKTAEGETPDLPFDINPSLVQPAYQDLKGWGIDLTAMREESSLPTELTDYIAYLEKQLETPITVVSVGPDRTQTIERKHAIA
jgi:adenylosuccinate synthase